MPVLGNPLGLLALLGIPVVLAIHFLQRKAKELPVSTLFLLERTRREAAGGRNFERLLPSIPLWMQLLGILLLAWLLAEPRYEKPASVQRVALVMDSSASMSVFDETMRERLGSILPKLQGHASALEIVALDAVPDQPRIYTGTSTDELLEAFREWRPRGGPVDPSTSLRLARSLVSREGTVLYVTDTPDLAAPPFDALRLAVGTPVENVGFTGVSFTREEGALIWRALVRNHGETAASRTWSIVTDRGRSEPRPLELAAGSLVTVQAAFPADAEHVRIVLSTDKFPWDDVLPLVAPAPKPLNFFAGTSPRFESLAAKLAASFDAAEETADAASADVFVSSYNPLDPVLPEGSALVFVEDETRTGAWLKGGIVAESHPLMAGLNWQSLLARETIQLERMENDQVLLWQDQRPLILLRENSGARQLLFNFDPTLSNIDKQPAFVVLVHRFVEGIREAKIAPVMENLETGQAIRLRSAPGSELVFQATDPAGKSISWTDPRRAPDQPCFLEIKQVDTTLLRAAAHFGDPREADLTDCGDENPELGGSRAALERQTKPDPLWRVWILLLLLSLLIAWKYSAPRQPTIEPAA